MTKKSKEGMIAFYVEKLNWLDMLIELNDDDDAAVQSLSLEYKRLIQELARIRDTPTTD